jgi:DNA-binding winged helix-turn-helix (wHTH) protein/tetratricopeptide (TPR) repeat protein
VDAGIEPWYEFGPFRLDCAARRLLNLETPVPLTPKAFDTLLELIRNSGRTVKKEALLEKIWPGTAVEENNLIQAISRIRKALGESLTEHRYIVTIPGQGYRFVAPVREVAPAQDVASAAGPQDISTRPLTRLIVIPFRILRPDPDTDFLAFSLADAITTSLMGVESLVVRSSLLAARLADEMPNLDRIASQAAVDLLLTGTLLRDGDSVRVNTQLVQVPGGTLIWSQISQETLGNIFQLQDSLACRIVLSLPMAPSSRGSGLFRRDVPVSPRAYEFYLRANQLSYDPAHWFVARDLYLQCVDLDPLYAPAWARLGRIYRLIGIYTETQADESLQKAEGAFKRALAINPDLTLAHNLYTALEVESGGAEAALLRLVERAQRRTPDPDLFAGLVHACRYCGLLDVAVAAYEQALRLDPNIRTSVAHAYWALGEYERAIETDIEKPPLIKIAALISMGHIAEASTALQRLEPLDLPGPMHHYIVAVRAGLEGRRSECLDATKRILESGHLEDPCARFYVARHLANVGEVETALANLRLAVDCGFCCDSVIAHDPWLDSLRNIPEFETILRQARSRHVHARTAFVEAGGDRIMSQTRLAKPVP